MKIRLGAAIIVLGLLFALPGFGQSSLSLPEGTKVSPIKLGDSETPVTLNPAEQVAFLMASSIWRLEENCYDKDLGLGRTVRLGDLVKGMKLKSGETAALKVNPAKDSNYAYDVMLIDDFCLIRAIPRNAKFGGAFALLGSPRGFGNTMYYSPGSPDLSKALKVTEMGWSGDGFAR